MSYKEVKELRQKGDFVNAYKVAMDAYRENPDDIWNKRALSWVYYDILKQRAEMFNVQAFIAGINEILKLKVPQEETLFYDSLCWVIRTIVSKIQSNEYYLLDAVFIAISQLSFAQSKGKSQLFREFHKHRMNWNSYIPFCEWWDFNSFMPEDYDYFTPENGGQKIMPLVEQAYIGYAGAILKSNDIHRIKAFIPCMDLLRTNYPKYQYPSYYLCRMHLAVGDRERAYNTIIPFVKTKPNDFWVWQLLGETKDDSSFLFKCYCKALCCKTKEEMLVSLKEKMALMLADRQLYSQAKLEIDDVVRIRQSNGWKISDNVWEMMKMQWYANVCSSKNNYDFYKEEAHDIEAILYQNAKTISIIVADVNEAKSIIRFIDINGRQGFLKYKGVSNMQIQKGGVYNVKVKKENSNCIEPLSIDMGDKNEWNNNIATVSGKMRTIKDKTFGFIKAKVGFVFIPPHIARGIEDGTQISGVAVKTYDKSKDKMSWTMIMKN